MSNLTQSVTLSVLFQINSVNKQFSFDLTFRFTSLQQCDLIETKEMKELVSVILAQRHLLPSLT